MLLSINSSRTIYKDEGGTAVYKVTQSPSLALIVWKLVHFDLGLSTPETMLWEERHFLDHGPRVWRMMGDSCEEGVILKRQEMDYMLQWTEQRARSTLRKLRRSRSRT